MTGFEMWDHKVIGWDHKVICFLSLDRRKGSDWRGFGGGVKPCYDCDWQVFGGGLSGLWHGIFNGVWRPNISDIKGNNFLPSGIFYQIAW